MLYAKISGEIIVVDEEFTGTPNVEEVRNYLQTVYPEVKEAAIAVNQTQEGHPIIEFTPKAGRKG